MIFQAIDSYFDIASDLIKLPEDQLKVVFCWVICIPLGFFQKLIHDPFIRNLYGLSIGFFLQFLCIREYAYLTLAASLIVYSMAKILYKKCDWPSFFFMYALLIGMHVERFFNDYYGWRIGAASVVMVMLCKITYFTFNYCDSKVEMPSLLDYLGYLYFFPSAIIGPVFRLESYLDFIRMKNHYAQIPSTVKATFKNVFFGISYLATLQILSPYLNAQLIFKTEWYQDLNFLLKFVVWHPIILLVQMRYLGAWKFAQAGMNACGISYQGKNKDGSDNFDHIITVQDSYLLDYNPIPIIGKWNTSVQVWLREVFYARFSKKFKPQTALLLVFTVSGIWHGVHPMYFISFIHFAVYNDVAKFLYKAQDKFRWIPKPVRVFLQYFVGKTCVNYFGLGFYLLEVSAVNEVYSTVYYTFTIIPVIMHIFFSVTGYGQKSKKKPTSEQQEQKDEKQKLQ